MPGARILRRSDRDVAVALLKRLARHPSERFCLFVFYDEDIDFLYELARDLGSPNIDTRYLIRRLRRICRRLEQAGVLAGRVSSCRAEYVGEPRVLKQYRFGDAGYAWRVAPDLYPHYSPMGSPDVEIDFLLRWAYPPVSERTRCN